MSVSKIKGNDCIFEKYLENPKKLCNTIAELLAQLHSINAKNCPIPNHSQNYLNTAFSVCLHKSFGKIKSFQIVVQCP